MIRLRMYMLIAAMTAGVATGALALQEQPGQTTPTVKPLLKRSSTPRELLKFNARLSRISQDLRVPGVAVAVVIGDRVAFLRPTGSRDAERRLHVKADTTFYIDACTKPFVAAAIVLLGGDGKIDLDAPVKTYLPRFELANAALTKTLTVRELLSHAKGVSSGPIDWLESFTGEITEDRFYAWLKKADVAQQHKYTHLHYTLAGRVIEAVTHKSWKKVVQERIFTPAGMSSATFSADAMYVGENVAFPTIRKEFGYAPSRIRRTDRTMNAAGGIGMSIDDMARWLRLNMDGGEIDGTKVFSKSAARAMHTLHASGGRKWPHFIRRTEDGHGLGWSIGSYQIRTLISHGSNFVGSGAHVSFMPDEKMGVVVLANADGVYADVVAMNVYDYLLIEEPDDLLPRYKGPLQRRLVKSLEVEMLFETNPLSGKGLALAPALYAGTYVNEAWGTVKVEVENGQLVGTLGDLTMRFASEGMDRFQVDYGLRKPEKGGFDTSADAVKAVLIHHKSSRAVVRYERK